MLCRMHVREQSRCLTSRRAQRKTSRDSTCVSSIVDNDLIDDLIDQRPARGPRIALNNDVREENVLHYFEEFVLISDMKFLACDKTVWFIATQRAHDQGDAKEKVVLLVNDECCSTRWHA